MEEANPGTESRIEDPYEGYYAQGNTSQRKTEAACYHLQVKSKTEQEDNITR